MWGRCDTEIEKLSKSNDRIKNFIIFLSLLDERSKKEEDDK